MRCQQTMVGFVQKANGSDKPRQTSIQCFYGVLDKSTKESDKLKSNLEKAEFNNNNNSTINAVSANNTIKAVDQSLNPDYQKLKK